MIEVFAERYKNELQTAAVATCKKLNVSPKDIDVEINIVTEEEIRTLNRENRNIDKVTDVLSFQNLEDIGLPFQKDEYDDVNPENGAVFLGEIFICQKRAEEQAREYDHSIERELSFLCCHGMLHLFGFDHDTAEKEEQMNGLCEEILTNIGQTRDKPFVKIQDQMENAPFHSGFVALMGRPNAGKSTLMNSIVGEKVSIVSWKPQTTRNKIKGIYNDKDCQIIFIYTPGLHKPKNSLGDYMMKTAASATEGIDCVVYVIDGEKGFLIDDENNIKGYIKEGFKVIAVVNKVDHITKESVMLILTKLNEINELTAVVPLSALRQRNIEPLIAEIKKLLTDTIKYYDEESYTDKNMRFITAEIIREKALRLLDKEVPYGIGVEVREYSYREDGSIIDINADIICEKQAHKPIILGKNGSMIKKIATYARQDLEKIAGTKIFLTLFVRVKEDWREDDSVMRMIGYDKKDLN